MNLFAWTRLHQSQFGCFSFAMLIYCVASFPGQNVWAQEKQQAIPDFTQGHSIPDGANHDWNLGPTGARGWIYSNRMETAEARQILITQVERGSPSENMLKVGDVILGVDGQAFKFDPRIELGKAIGQAESKNGKLAFILWRNGKTDNVTLNLPVLGSYSATAPFNCSKSDLIFEKGCAALAHRMQENPANGNGIVRSLNALALLSSGRKEYLPLVKEQVEWASRYSDVEGRSLNCWFYGPINMLLAEYTLATGDTSCLKDLERITMEIVNGQSAVGSWGHRFSRPDGRLNGYGMMNAPGLPLTVSLVLAKKAGVQNPELDIAIEKSSRLIRFYVGKGCVPYGDHAPWMETHDDNGKNGIAAILFQLLGDEEAATYFSRMSVASHSGEREMGHTGNFFNMLWAMPGVALSGPQACGAWMEEFGWYYDLARRWDGTFQHQGPAEPRRDKYHNWDSTGAYLLAYAQGRRQLSITGKTTGLTRQVDRDEANQLIADGRGFSHKNKHEIYSDKSNSELLEALTSWSPIVRNRAAQAVARRETNLSSEIIELLQSTDTYAQLGGCEALVYLKERGEKAIPALRKLLFAEHLWLRIKAANALSSMGNKALEVVPDLLKMVCEWNVEDDPRAMQQRFLCFALFDRRSGLLSRSLEGVDRDALFEAVRAGLQNEDGRARGVIASVYRNLSFDEIKPLLPEIHRAVVESAPSGIMFADGIRLSGLEVLAKYRIAEGMELCLDVIEMDRWGQGKRLPKCLAALEQYGGAARELIPGLEALAAELQAGRQNQSRQQQVELVKATIKHIKNDANVPQLRSLSDIH